MKNRNYSSISAIRSYDGIGWKEEKIDPPIRIGQDDEIYIENKDDILSLRVDRSKHPPEYAKAYRRLLKWIMRK